MTPRALARRAQDGIALIEVLVAVLILAIGLLGTIGLQARAFSALSEAGMRAEATIAANELLGVMSSDLANLDDYALAAGAEPGPRLEAWHAALRERLPGASVAVTVAPQPNTRRTAVGITIRWQRSPDTPVNAHRITSYLAESL